MKPGANHRDQYVPPDLAGCDLTGVDFSGADLADVDLSGSNLTNAVFDGADLTGADVTDAQVVGASGRPLSIEGIIGADATIGALVGAAPGQDLAHRLDELLLHLEPPADVSASLVGVCQGSPVPDAGTSPGTTYHAIAQFRGGTPAGDLPAATRFVELVACIDPPVVAEVLGNCSYVNPSANGPLVLYSTHVRLLNPQTAELIAEETLVGPRTSCPMRRPVDQGGSPVGELPDVDAWLAPYVGAVPPQ